MEELVGNQPFKGTGRRFLLWSAPDDLCDEGDPTKVLIPAAEVKKNFRLEKLHKLGVLTIFDDELEEEIGDAKVIAVDWEEPKAEDHEQRLALLIKKLGKVNDYRRRKMRKAEYGPAAWREVEFRSQLLESGPARPESVRFTWQFVREIETKDVVAQQSAFKDLRPADWSMRVVTSRPGTQKGTQAEVAVLAWSHPICDAAGRLVADPNRPSMLVNASLRLDTDSMLEGMCQFLCQASGIGRNTGKKPKAEKGGDEEEARPDGISRETLFDQGRLFRPVAGKKPLIVFRGLERLFSKSGVPLSAELDNFFRNYLLAAIEAKKSGEPKRLCRIIVFGSRRVRVYFRELQRLIEREFDAGSKAKKRVVVRPKSILVIERRDDSPSGYLIWQSKQFALPGYETEDSSADDGTSAVPLAEDRAFAKRTYERLFSIKKFVDTFASIEDRNLAFAIMTVMAFIGQPVEQCVLLHVPRIIEALDLQVDDMAGWKKGADRLQDIFEVLINVNLVNEIGRPIITSEGGDLPKTKTKEYHSPRYALHKSLQIEFRERYGVPLSEAALSTSFNMSLYAAQPADSVLPEPEVHDELGKMIDWLIGAHKDVARIKGISDADPDKIRQCRAAPEAAAALRAGLAILRGFYSTTALLSLDLDDRLVSERRDGALTEHADRIERLIRSFELMAKERFDFDNALNDEGKSQAERSDALGPGPIYKDELVWLHNERGVVKLAQGDLYEARHSFDAADQINRRYVEFGCRSHNWRRIWLNQLAVDFERGKLTEAEDRIGRIEASLHSAEEIETIRRVLATFPAGAQPLLPLHVSHEDCLAVALTTGYRALIQFQRGELPDSEQMFKVAIAMLQALDEQRACALMRRYFASLLWVMEGVDEMSKMAKLAGAGAESYQQMDIVYAARIIKHHKHAISERADDRLVAMRTFTRALDFATQTDLHRVAIEARRSLAGLKLQNGDYESALEHARIAMALAGRYGFVLFKISIRILLGRILIARDNEVAGMSLIRNAISQADRIGYQRGIDAAQFAIQSLVRGR